MRDFSLGTVEHLVQLAQFSHEESRFWKALVEDRLEVLTVRHGDAVSIPITKLLSPLEIDIKDNTVLHSLSEVHKLIYTINRFTFQPTDSHREKKKNYKNLALRGNVNDSMSYT